MGLDTADEIVTVIMFCIAAVVLIIICTLVYIGFKAHNAWKTLVWMLSVKNNIDVPLQKLMGVPDAMAKNGLDVTKLHEFFWSTKVNVYVDDHKKND